MLIIFTVSVLVQSKARADESITFDNLIETYRVKLLSRDDIKPDSISASEKADIDEQWKQIHARYTAYLPEAKKALDEAEKVDKLMYSLVKLKFSLARPFPFPSHAENDKELNRQDIVKEWINSLSDSGVDSYTRDFKLMVAIISPKLADAEYFDFSKFSADSKSKFSKLVGNRLDSDNRSSQLTRLKDLNGILPKEFLFKSTNKFEESDRNSAKMMPYNYIQTALFAEHYSYPLEKKVPIDLRLLSKAEANFLVYFLSDFNSDKKRPLDSGAADIYNGGLWIKSWDKTYKFDYSHLSALPDKINAKAYQVTSYNAMQYIGRRMLHDLSEKNVALSEFEEKAPSSTAESSATDKTEEGKKKYLNINLFTDNYITLQSATGYILAECDGIKEQINYIKNIISDLENQEQKEKFYKQYGKHKTVSKIVVKHVANMGKCSNSQQLEKLAEKMLTKKTAELESEGSLASQMQMLRTMNGEGDLDDFFVLSVLAPAVTILNAQTQIAQIGGLSDAVKFKTDSNKWRVTNVAEAGLFANVREAGVTIENNYKVLVASMPSAAELDILNNRLVEILTKGSVFPTIKDFAEAKQESSLTRVNAQSSEEKSDANATSTASLNATDDGTRNDSGLATGKSSRLAETPEPVKVKPVDRNKLEENENTIDPAVDAAKKSLDKLKKKIKLF